MGILTAASCTTVLQGSNVENAAMNICWPFHVNEGISVRHAIRRESWNSGNGYVKKY